MGLGWAGDGVGESNECERFHEVYAIWLAFV